MEASAAAAAVYAVAMRRCYLLHFGGKGEERREE